MLVDHIGHRLRQELCQVEVPTHGVFRRRDLRFCRRRRPAGLSEGGLKQAAGLIDAIELEKRLYLLRSSTRFGVDVLDDLATRKSHLRVLARPRDGGLEFRRVGSRLVLIRCLHASG